MAVTLRRGHRILAGPYPAAWSAVSDVSSHGLWGRRGGATSTGPKPSTLPRAQNFVQVSCRKLTGD
jgi:hypothetical protein